MKHKYLHHTITLLLMLFVFVLQAQEVIDTTSENVVVKKEKKGSRSMKSYLRLMALFACFGFAGLAAAVE